MVDISNQFNKLLSLPSLEQWSASPLPTLSYEVGVFGKLAGSTTDYGLIAKSNAFSLDSKNYHKHFYIGNSDNVNESPTFMWKIFGKKVYVASISRSNRKDSNNRISLQTVVFCSNVSVDIIPAPIQALVLLPAMRKLQAIPDYLSHLVEGVEELDSYDSVLNIYSSKHPHVALTSTNVVDAFQIGLSYIQQHFNVDQLANLYSVLLEGGQPAFLSEQQHYPVEIVGVLLIFLDRIKANSFSIVENLPSSNSTLETIENNWDIILNITTGWERSLLQISESIRSEADQVAKIVTNYKLLSDIGGQVVSSLEDNSVIDSGNNSTSSNYTLWGPSSAGKSVFLAQLFLEGARFEEDWDVRLLSRDSQQYMAKMRHDIHKNNCFPAPTVMGHDEFIELLLVNESAGIKAKLQMQDRAGGHYSGESRDDGSIEVDKDIINILLKSSGLIILIDPSREKTDQLEEVSTTLYSLQEELSNGYEKIKIPVAVCLTKADGFIRTLDDLNFARTDPDAFVRTYAEKKLIDELEKSCKNYSLFPVSAIGMKVSENNVSPIVFYDDELNSRVIPCDETEVVNLISPFIWLVDQAG